MNRLVRQTAVIARRDFVATVFTPTFLIFLLAPFFMILLGVVGGLGASRAGQASVVPGEIVALVSAEDATRLHAADGALRRIYRAHEEPPALRTLSLPADPASAARTLIARPDVQTGAVLYGPLDRPHILVGPLGPRAGDYLARLAEDALRAGRAGIAVDARLSQPIVERIAHKAPTPRGKEGLGFGAVFVLFFLTLLLAGQAVGTMAEEKSNKVIEILAAAVPLEAVFLGKLIGMFGVALLFIAFWGALAVIGIAQAPVDAALSAHLSPAIGLPAFLVLAAAYFTMAYLLLGAVFLGVGAQAATVREIQLLSLPITLFQVAMFGMSSAAASDPGSTVARVAEIFPFSSPFAMAARAATETALWPHLLALGWQALWVAITIIVSARLFRRGVLKSGSGTLFRRRRPQAPDASLT